MVEYVTRAELINLGRAHLAENLQKVERARERSPQNSTFLSHSSKDDEVMPVVVRILENHGAIVYLDKKDPLLSGQRPSEIASTLRERLAACRKFVLFASENVKASKWVPWELGLADGHRKPRNVCIFPAPDKAADRQWTEQEYLGIYDRVVWGNFTGSDKREWLVWNFVSNVALPLRRWLEQ